MRRVAVVVCVLTLAAPLLAQDGSEVIGSRTPENAQRFLNVTGAQYPVIITPNIQISGYDWYLQYSPTRMVSSDRCVTIFDGEVNRFYAKDANGQFFGGANELDPVKNAGFMQQRPDLIAKYKIATAPYVVDWSKVTYLGKRKYWDASRNTMVDQDGTIQISAGEVNFVVYPPSVELAARMTLAMETLKKACDKTEGLGF